MSRARPPYVELRAMSAFSFGDGSATPEALVERAAALGYTSLGLTDRGDLGGIVRFATEAERHGVRPVIGAELLVEGRPAALLARTAEGYRNLAALITRARAGRLRQEREGPDRARALDLPPRGRPEVAWSDLAERSAGLHALTGPLSGPIAWTLRDEGATAAARRLAAWRELFGERLAVEVQLHQAGRAEEALAGGLIRLAEQEGVPWVVCGNPRYLDRGGRLVHDVLTALRAGLTLEEAGERGVLLPNGSWRLESPDAMAARWTGCEAGLEESARIAAECGFALSWLRPPLPRFPVPAGYTDDSYLREQVEAGAVERWGSPDVRTDAQRRQIEHELRVIARLGFSGFFLIIWDVLREARRRRILCQGRGSAANSAVAYCLGITAVDPVRHGLLFERFLNEKRVDGQTEAPDIDVDVEHDRREELLDFVYERWRRDGAAITCIVQTYAAPNAVQDAMRAFGYPHEMALALSKRLHYVNPAAGAERLREGLGAQFGLDVEAPRGRALLGAIAGFEHLPRLRSTHPGGFVLSAGLLGDHCPIEPTTMGRTIIQFDKDDLDAIGIPKFDFLGLGALSMVRHAFDAIEARGGRRPSIYQLPQDDAKTFRMIARGDTVGTFQIESRAQIASLVHTCPERLYDLVVQVALIRPGPIQAKFVHPYTRRRRGLEHVTFLHPALEPILARTQGIPIFQEQAMAIAMALGGYTGAEADELRRTMGNNRKRPRLMAALEKLRGRMVERGVAGPVAARITEDLESFANYGFPESHAWSFALIAYATAWLKAHEPAAFYAGLLNAWPMGFYSPATLVHDARRHRVEVRRPCLARGDALCTLEESGDPRRPALRIGWRLVHGIGETVLDRLRAARAAAPFASIPDAVHRACLTRGESASLARAGAFGGWEPDRRRAAWEAIRVAADTLPLAPAHTETGQTGGTGFAPRPLDRDDTIALDYRSVGLSTVGHPMERLRPWCRRMGVLDSRQARRCRNGTMALVAGLVTTRQRPETAKGTVFLLLEDEHGSVNAIVSRVLDEQFREAVHHSTFLAVHGRVERHGALVNVIGQRFESLDHLTGGEDIRHRSRDFR